MQKIKVEDAEEHLAYFAAAAQIAQRATCLRAQCGSIIVKDGEIIGRGYNSPPLDNESNRTCLNVYPEDQIKPRYDKTCCIHAEWRAILDACKRHPNKIAGSTLYFMRPGYQGVFTDAGEPYCTTCSRLAMEAGISYFALWNENLVCLYECAEYDRLSYKFFKPKITVNSVKTK